MNVVQLVRKARLGCDAIMPGGAVSTLWQDDELVDLVTEANEDLNTALRLVRKKWGLQSVTYQTAPFARDGETYTPSSSLVLPMGATSTLLPPDIGEVVRVVALDDPSIRFAPAAFESPYWIDMDLSARQSDGSFIGTPGLQGQTYYYDVTGQRTLTWTPPMLATVSIGLDYTPMKRPLYWTSTGTVTVTQGSTTVAGNGTAWRTEGLYAADSSQAAELLIGVMGLADPNVRLDRDYPSLATLTDDAHATLSSPWGPLSVTNAPYVLAMAPTLPRVYHRWIARLAAVLMLSKINPDLSEKYSQSVMRRFTETIRPSAGVRQIQSSTVTDDEHTLGGLTD